MKAILNIIGAILIVFGVVWILQGLNVLPGSFMTGHAQWAVYGAAAVIVGIILLMLSNRRRSSPPPRTPPSAPPAP
jgi:uncharacterized membrane protein HdeD (DUF308 family)